MTGHLTHCHDGLQAVFKHGKATIWAGSLYEARERVWSLRICLGVETAFERASPVANAAATELLGDVPKIVEPVLFIPWPDREAPVVGYEFWAWLADRLATIPGDVCVHCMGGHGRTGTALAALALVTGQCEPTQIVNFVRKRHCGQAVESTAQLSYLDTIAGCTVEGDVPTSRWSGAQAWGANATLPITTGASGATAKKGKGK